jgi:predicted DNA binding CopG/RHH family protein
LTTQEGRKRWRKFIRLKNGYLLDGRREETHKRLKKAIPKFKSENKEFEFWSAKGAGMDSTAFVDWSKAKRTKLPNLKPTLRTISARLPVAMIEDLKILANKRDVPYRSLLKVFLAERLEQERRLRRAG